MNRSIARVRNWRQFQHYKDRSPPWIKLHRSLLDDFEFARLPAASKALAPMLWLLAAESSEGSVCVDPDWLAFRLRWSASEVREGLPALIEAGLLECDSDVLAECGQRATPEREGEPEEEESPNGDSCGRVLNESDSIERIPYQAIVDLYNRTMVALPKVRVINPARRQLIKRAFAEPKWRSLGFWESFFAECQDDAWLNGTGPYNSGWEPNFDHLLSTKVLTRIYERGMDRMERAA